MTTLLAKRRSIRARILIPIAATTLIAAGGAAVAAIPDSGGVIHGCYSKGLGSLRVIDTAKTSGCRPSETALTWNLQGPKGDTGPQGLQGPAGPKGDTGAQGPSDAYSSTINASPQFDQSGLDVGSISLPAGSYVIVATTELVNFTPSATTSGGCGLYNNFGGLVGGTPATIGTGESDPLTAQGVATLPSPVTIVMHCWGNGLNVSGGEIIATKVGALHP